MSPRRSAGPGRADRDLTAAGEDYLKVIHNAQEWSDEPVTTSLLAARLGVGAPTVSETVRRLVDRGLVEHPRYGAVDLTPEGRRVALRMVRRHRLLETWLVEHLGYGWDEVHDEAEVLEHAVSDLFVERLDRMLGHPVRDPHGDPVPDARGVVVMPSGVLLSELPAGTSGTVVRVSDADPAVLRECSRAGVRPDARVTAPTALSPAARAAVRVAPDA